MTTSHHPRTRILVRRAQRGINIGLAALAEVQTLLGNPAADRVLNLLGTQTPSPESLFNRPMVDGAAMTVTWQGTTCRLRSRIHVALMIALTRRLGRFVTFEQLLNEVWSGDERDDGTVRSTVRHLRGVLRVAGMDTLAEAIHSSGRRYGLVFSQK